MKKQNFNALKQGVFLFKKWGRKNFSAFQSLKKVIAIATLVVAYHLSADAKNYVEPVDSLKTTFELDLDEIEVSAQRSPVTYSQAARIISVIERDEIEAAPVESIQELLEYVPGIDIRTRGGEGVQSDINIRGSSFDQVLILLNGVNITDPQTGHHHLNLPVSLNQIQRIEVLEGSASRVFGPNAFSGAINIITKDYINDKLAGSVSFGDYSYLNADVSGSLKTGDLNHFVAFNNKKSDGYINNTDFESSNVYYKLNAQIGKDNFMAQFGYAEKAFGANSFYTPKYPNQFEETNLYFTSLKFESNSKIHLTPTIYWRRHFDRFELFRDEAPSWYTNHNYHRTDAAGAGVNSWFSSRWGKTSFGVEHRIELIFSNVLGTESEIPVKVPGENASYTKSASRETTSLFFEHSYLSEQWTIAAGVMANVISDSDQDVNFFPGIDISYSFHDTWKLYSSFSKSLRMPTFTDLYYNGPTNLGNPDLRPETATSVEGGLKLNGLFVKGHLTLFYRNGENIIDWVKTENEEKWHTENLTSLISSGAEIELNVYPQQKFGAKFPFSKISVSYLYNNLSKKENDFISNYVLDNLKHKFDLNVSHRIWKNISANWNVLIQDRNGAYTEFMDGNFTTEVNYEPFMLVGGKITFTKPIYAIYISSSNIFNTTYYDIGNVVQPRRWIKAGIRVDINFK